MRTSRELNDIAIEAADRFAEQVFDLRLEANALASDEWNDLAEVERLEVKQRFSVKVAREYMNQSTHYARQLRRPVPLPKVPE